MTVVCDMCGHDIVKADAVAARTTFKYDDCGETYVLDFCVGCAGRRVEELAPEQARRLVDG